MSSITAENHKIMSPLSMVSRSALDKLSPKMRQIISKGV